MKKKVLKATGYVFFLSIIAKVIGFLKSIIQASYYGATIATDAYNMASGIVTNVLYMLTTALSVAFVPLYIQKKAKAGVKGANEFASRIITVLTISALFLIIVLEVIAPYFMRVVAPSYSGEVLYESTLYFRVMILGYVFALVSALYQNLLNAEKMYGYSSITSIVNSFVLIALILFFSKKIGVWALVIAIPISYFVQCFFLYVRGCNYGKFTIRYGVKDDSLKKMCVQALPILISQATVEINQVVDRALLSSMEEGVVTAVSYSAVLYQFVVHIISIPISTVMFTELSEASVKGNLEYIRRNLNEIYKLIIIICLPILLAVLFSAKDIVDFIYGRGMFDDSAVEKTALGLVAYIFCVIPVTIKSVLTKAYYALYDTKRPMILGILEVILNITLSVTLSRYFGILGVLGATAIASAMFTAIMIIVFDVKYINVTENIWNQYKKVVIAIAFSFVVTMLIKTIDINFGNSLLNFLFHTIIVYVTYGGGLIMLKESHIYILLKTLTTLWKTK